ncbi:MAG: DUF3540 domain-containing protein [Desulfonauticus sp.]|nr:DUF3540 domain-containing protein [Desulfonauticus sp.]
MRYPVKETSTSLSWMEQGEIVFREDNKFLVTTSSGKVWAERAISCLVEPVMGDRVLISRDISGDAFVLAVLKRMEYKRDHDIVLSGNINIISRDGRVSVQSQKEVNISTHGHLRFASRDFDLHAQDGKVAINKLSFVGKLFSGQIKTIKMVCASVEHFIGRLTQKLQNCFKFVKEHDEVQSGSSRYLVEDMLTVQSKNALHQAEEVITINGEQVHLG